MILTVPPARGDSLPGPAESSPATHRTDGDAPAADLGATAFRLRRESVRILASDDIAACSVAVPSPAGAAAAAFAAETSAAVAARYPLRARTSTPGRFTRTLMLWNLPSSFPLVE